MTPYDAAMAAVILAGMVWGALRGVTWQIAGIASLVLGYMVSHPLSVQLAPHLPGEPVVARTLAMMVVYAAVSCGVFFAAWLVRATLHRLKFEAFDRHLGMLLGGSEGLLLGLLATLFAVSLDPQTRGPIFRSPTGRLVGQLMAAVGPVLPSEAREVLSPFWSTDLAKVDPAPAVADEPAPGAKDGASSSASFQDLIRQGEARIGQAIGEGAADGLKQAAGGGANGGTVERR